MNINEAYELALKSIDFLRNKGLMVSITDTKSKNDPNIISKYSSTDGLEPKKWVHVSIEYSKDVELNNLISLEEIKFHNSEIFFDKGCGFGKRDWELDWSFRLVNNMNNL